MKKMKTKRLFAVLLTLVMVLGMTSMAFATSTVNPKASGDVSNPNQGDPETPPVEETKPTTPITIPEGTDKGNTVRPQGQETPGVASKSDKAVVTIQGISGNPTVTLYQIAEGKYDESGVGLIKYVPVSGASLLPEQPTSGDINKAHQEILEGQGKLVQTAKKVSGTYFVSDLLPVGAYIAIISGADDGSIYNPVLLTVSYNENGILEAGAVNLVNGYLYGSTAVAKKTEPDVDKKITDGTTPDNPNDGTSRETASVGDIITYEVEPAIPSYPENAINKTLFFKDTMSEGLTFLFDSLKIKFKEDETREISSQKSVSVNGDKIITFTVEDAGELVTIAQARETANGFYLNFVYDALSYTSSVADGETGDDMRVEQHVYTPIITYQAVLNDKAVVGDAGNPNDMKMIFTNTPNEGSTFEPTDDNPEPGPDMPGYTEKEDIETVYTYELAFLKTGEGDDKDKLAGAVFGIYTNYSKETGCSGLIDTVVTDANGYAISSQVEAGTYYIKELIAPTGYQLNDKVYSIVATQTSATSTITKEKREWKYTTNAAEVSGDPIQVGWIDTKNNDDDSDDVFYSLDATESLGALFGITGGEASPEGDGGETGDNMGIGQVEAPKGVLPAYVLYDRTVKTTETVTVGTGTGTAMKLIDMSLKEGDEGYNPGSIPNTKLSGLPSTGGIGTTIFTIAGCLIMILAAALFFASRRKSSKK